MTSEEMVALNDLADKWARRAIKKLNDGAAQTDVDAKRFIEHGAFCYGNCAIELRELIKTKLDIQKTQTERELYEAKRLLRILNLYNEELFDPDFIVDCRKLLGS